MSLPTPDKLITRFERGEIDREELHAQMALHARNLIREMEEDHQNPAAALIERVMAARHARRLAKPHGARLVRECLVALSEAPGFPPAEYLWNASHPDLPLHCFMRMRRKPRFRIVAIHRGPDTTVRCHTEHDCPDNGRTRIEWKLARDAAWRLHVT